MGSVCWKGIMYQSGCDICCVVLTLNRSVEVGLTLLISDRGGAENKETTGGGRGKQMQERRQSA